MKIAVYTICKNESMFIDRWLDSAKDADLLLVTDTGSTDDSIDRLEYYKVHKHAIKPNLIINTVNINPWRFDDARNFSLMSLPKDIDICIALDMDEVLVEGWREKVEKAYKETNLDRLRYNFIWSWNDDGTPGLTYYADKIHKRHGYRWINPVHEVLIKDSRLGKEIQVFIDDTLIEHHPDNTKSRSDYLPLLYLATQENPYNDRNSHYYARELLFNKKYEEAIIEFQRHLNLPTSLWNSERAASYRYIGDCYWSLGDYNKAIDSFIKASLEAPAEREAYVSLAQAYRFLGQWQLVIENCEKALAITKKPNTYICQPHCWSDWPNQMLDEALAKKYSD
jgi:tetratricopeptide (TPR) repeat protein